jgi:hypothetical protein
MQKSTIMIVVLSCIIVLQILLLSNFYTRFLLLNLIEANDPDDAYVITNDVSFTSYDGHTISLPAGTVLHGPCRHDLPYTDLGDPQIMKVYIEPNVNGMGVIPLANAPRGFPLVVLRSLKLNKTQLTSEQAVAPYR